MAHFRRKLYKMAPHISKGRLPPFTFFHSPFTIFKRPPSTTIVVPLPLTSRGRQDFEKMESRHYAYLPTPAVGVGGERLYTLLRPTACGAGEDHEVARGGICRWHTSAGSYIKWRPIFPKGAFLHLPFFIHHLPFLKGPLPPLRGPPPPVKRWEASLRRKRPLPPLYLLAHPRCGGGWRAKRDGRGHLPCSCLDMIK